MTGALAVLRVARPRVLPALRRVAVVGVLGLVIANVAIAGLSMAMQASASEPALQADELHKLRVVDDRVLRGAAPSDDGYRELAALGVTTVVDLRAESGLEIPVDLLADLGVAHVALPVRDGQTPTSDQVRTFLSVVDGADGLVYVHCGAGVGRTGAMVAAYRVATGEASGVGALADNLAVGPPSLEQIYYAAFLGDGFHRPPALVSAVSRFLDAPRRLWSRYGF